MLIGISVYKHYDAFDLFDIKLAQSVPHKHLFQNFKKTSLLDIYSGILCIFAILHIRGLLTWISGLSQSIFIF